MDLIFKLQVHMVALSILMIIYDRLRREEQVYSLQDRLFRVLTGSMMAPIILEGITRVVNGQPGQLAYRVHMGSNVLLFIVNSLQIAVWILYMIGTFERDKKYLIKVFMPIGMVLMINTLLALSTPMTKLYFYIDQTNGYHRGAGYAISMGIAGLLFLYNYYIVIVNWKRISKRNRLPILSFLLPPIIGMILQGLFYGVSLIWAGGAISILIVYISIQSQVANTDYLTGLYNRRYLDGYLDRKIRNLPKDKQFGGIMVDIDDFKKINDAYGHTVGDQALKTATRLIQSAFHKEVFVARYGGDEFVVLLDKKNEKQLKEAVGKIKEKFDLFNEKNKDGYKLKISAGYCVYRLEDGCPEGFTCRLDSLMYDEKNQRKECQQRCHV